MEIDGKFWYALKEWLSSFIISFKLNLLRLEVSEIVAIAHAYSSNTVL